MNLENQLQVSFAMNAEHGEQIYKLSRANWSQEERLRQDASCREEMMRFYDNQMENLCKEQQELIDAAVAKITKSFEEQISKLIAEHDVAKLQRGKYYGKKSERNGGDGNDSQETDIILLRECPDRFAAV